MNKLSSRKNKAGSHQHKSQTLVTKIVAIPLFPGKKNGRKLPMKTFPIVDYLVGKGKPNKKSWEVAQSLAEKACNEFINENGDNEFGNPYYWILRKGLKTSFRYSVTPV